MLDVAWQAAAPQPDREQTQKHLRAQAHAHCRICSRFGVVEGVGRRDAVRGQYARAHRRTSATYCVMRRGPCCRASVTCCARRRGPCWLSSDALVNCQEEVSHSCCGPLDGDRRCEGACGSDRHSREGGQPGELVVGRRASQGVGNQGRGAASRPCARRGEMAGGPTDHRRQGHQGLLVHLGGEEYRALPAAWDAHHYSAHLAGCCCLGRVDPAPSTRLLCIVTL